MKVTHVSLLIKLVIGQFNFIEWNHLSHPLLTKRGRIRVNINASWHRCVCISRHDPLRAVVCISVWKKISKWTYNGKREPSKRKTWLYQVWVHTYCRPKSRYSLERFKQNYVVQAPNCGRGVFHPRETHKEWGYTLGSLGDTWSSYEQFIIKLLNISAIKFFLSLKQKDLNFLNNSVSNFKHSVPGINH